MPTPGPGESSSPFLVPPPPRSFDASVWVVLVPALFCDTSPASLALPTSTASTTPSFLVSSSHPKTPRRSYVFDRVRSTGKAVRWWAMCALAGWNAFERSAGVLGICVERPLALVNDVRQLDLHSGGWLTARGVQASWEAADAGARGSGHIFIPAEMLPRECHARIARHQRGMPEGVSLRPQSAADAERVDFLLDHAYVILEAYLAARWAHPPPLPSASIMRSQLRHILPLF
ncbi:hypothetical protein B0H14DRAFT_3528977 [Mycena olivaceomarginata]|nr:hypothetical protein B0H14DRAFT_3528977 [Mycena olivaceomarginata]